MFMHFLSIFILLFSSFFSVGIPLYMLTFFTTGNIVGFIITSFTMAFHLKGLIFAIIFLIFNYIFYLILLILLFPKCLQLAINFLKKILTKKNSDLFNYHLLKCSFIFILGFIIIDLINLFISPKVLNIFHFLLT